MVLGEKQVQSCECRASRCVSRKATSIRLRSVLARRKKADCKIAWGTVLIGDKAERQKIEKVIILFRNKSERIAYHEKQDNDVGVD